MTHSNLNSYLTKINILSKKDYRDKILSALHGEQLKIFSYINTQVYYEASKKLEYKKYLDNCNYLIADGYSFVWAYKKIKKIQIEKVVFTYSYFNFIRDDFISLQKSFFFLGSTPQNILKAVENERRKYPNLKIAGFHHGFFDKKNETNKILKLINNSNADALVVGMGFPIAEKWIYLNKDKLNVKIIFSVGGFFDFLAEKNKLAPSFLYNSGFEWLFRLIQEPSRLFKRYLFSNLFFLKNFVGEILNKP